jgi:hypothetical protein
LGDREARGEDEDESEEDRAEGDGASVLSGGDLDEDGAGQFWVSPSMLPPTSTTAPTSAKAEPVAAMAAARMPMADGDELQFHCGYEQPALRSCSQAGLVKQPHDALAWGLFALPRGERRWRRIDRPRRLALPGGLSVAQIATGHWSDRAGRKPLIAAGMLVQALALAVIAAADGSVAVAAASAVVLGFGAARVYPTLIAAMSDAVADQQRIARQHEPGLVGAPVVGHEIGIVRERVPRRGDRPDLRVAKRDDLVVRHRVMANSTPARSGR